MNDYKEVYFQDYCSKCKYEENAEHEDPCWDCLGQPVQQNSHKPAEFKEK